MRSEIEFRGSSMYPALCEGDSLTVLYYPKPLDLNQIPIGKVVLLKDENEWLVHRVICKNQKIITKGDWSYPLDNVSEVWGEVIAINGKSKAILQSPVIARLSSNLNKKQSRVTRYIMKTLLMMLSVSLRNLNGRRSHDVYDEYYDWNNTYR